MKKSSQKSKPAEKIVLDTNVLISALLSPQGACYTLLEELLQKNTVQLYTSEKLFTELHRVLQRPRIATKLKDYTDGLVQLYAQVAMLCEETTDGIYTRDTDDTEHLRMAAAIGATIITGDEDLLSVKDSPIPILTVRQAMKKYL